MEAVSKEIWTLARRVAEAASVVVFTGAGISTESGIPDYRSQGGLWDRFQPVYFDEFMSDRKARIRYWEQRMAMEPHLACARPNPGHLALARLEKLGRLNALITQNIDGLHQASGVSPQRIIELHGNTRKVRCMSCQKIVPLEKTLEMIRQGNPAPDCPCGGPLKPDTISFGQAMVQEKVEAAARLSGTCDLFIAVGSTLQVYPAASMPEIAKRAGAFTVIINLTPTPFDPRCDLIVRDQAGPVLAAVADLVASGS